MIEYEHTRIYLHSLALEAVIQRCIDKMSSSRSENGDSGPLEGKGNAVHPSTISKWIGDDRQTIEVIVTSCRNVLKIVSEQLYPAGALKHVPVRTYFRIISVIIILLKVCNVS